MPTQIFSDLVCFQGEDAPLSNLHNHPIRVLEQTHASNEHAYQFLKLRYIGKHLNNRQVAKELLFTYAFDLQFFSPSTCKTVVRKALKFLQEHDDSYRPIVLAWYRDHAVPVLRELFWRKLESSDETRRLVQYHRGCQFFEITPSKRWGVGYDAKTSQNLTRQMLENCPGDNMFGKIVYEVGWDFAEWAACGGPPHSAKRPDVIAQLQL